MKTAYVVLGMHRSGTSSVAGALALLGATPPLTLMPAKTENPKGFWESEVIMGLNDEILAACGSAWNDWRELDTRALESGAGRNLQSRAAQALASEFGDADTIVLKDPRICRFYGFWRDVLQAQGYEPLVVSPLRSPYEVAASLMARNTISQEDALRLWQRHVLDAEKATRGHPRHLMAWTDFMTDWRGQTQLMSQRLGRSIEAKNVGVEAALDAFLTPELRRHDHSEFEQDNENSYAQIRKILLALTGEDEQKLHDALDEINDAQQEC